MFKFVECFADKIGANITGVHPVLEADQLMELTSDVYASSPVRAAERQSIRSDIHAVRPPRVSDDEDFEFASSESRLERIGQTVSSQADFFELASSQQML